MNKMKNLKKRIIRRGKDESGQALVTFALSAIFVLMVSGLVIDYGRPALQTRRLQNAADSAVLAASHYLPLSTSASQDAIRQSALDMAKANGYDDPADVEVLLEDSYNGKYHQVTVRIKETVEFTFGKIMGKQSQDLSRHATVALAPVAGVYESVPLGIKENVFLANVASGQYNMILKYGGGSGTNGDYGFTDPDGSQGGGANDTKYWMQHNYAGKLEIGDEVYIENGNMSSVAPYVTARHGNCACTPDHYDPNCPRIMIVPIVTTGTTKDLKITGFAPFFLTTAYAGTGNSFVIEATYMPGYVIDDAVLGGGTDYGLYGRKLVD